MHIIICIDIQSKIIISLVKMEEKGSPLPESMAKSSSAGGSICLHIYILIECKPTQLDEGQWNFSDVHLDLENAFLGESILSLNHSLT